MRKVNYACAGGRKWGRIWFNKGELLPA